MATTTFPIALAPSARRGAGVVPASLAVALRTARKFIRTPQLVVMSTVQGGIFLLIFRYVFGGAVHVHGLGYVDFLIPGFVTTGVLFVGTGTSAGVAEDIEGGFFDRLRSLPIPRSATIIGRAIADVGLITWSLAITTVIGFLVGFRIHGGIGPSLAGFAMCVFFGFAFTWMFITIGLIAGNAQAAEGFSLLVFPLTFVSGAYVPVSSMPGWLQGFASYQPITFMVNAVRCLSEGQAAVTYLGHSTAYYLVGSLLWSAALVAVFAPLAVARYSRA